jgi:hypothetical protein
VHRREGAERASHTLNERCHRHRTVVIVEAGQLVKVCADAAIVIARRKRSTEQQHSEYEYELVQILLNAILATGVRLVNKMVKGLEVVVLALRPSFSVGSFD